AELLQVMDKQKVEISRATSAFTVTFPPKKKQDSKKGHASKDSEKDKKDTEPTTREFPAGSYIIRMDQPYSRIADALLDHQYWSPEDPQKTPYDDTGWTFGELFGVQVVRVTDAKVLSAAMERVNSVKLPGGVKGDGTVFAINNNAQPTLATLRYKLKDATMEAAEEPFEVGGTKFNRGTVLVKGVSKGDLDKAAGEAGVEV